MKTSLLINWRNLLTELVLLLFTFAVFTNMWKENYSESLIFAVLIIGVQIDKYIDLMRDQTRV